MPRLRGLIAAALGALVVALCGMVAADDARAARGMEISLQDDPVFVGKEYFNSTRGYSHLKKLGVSRLKINVVWAYTLSDSQARARQKPANLAYNFGTIDNAIDEAAKNGIRVHLALTGGAPAWATGNKKTGPYKPSVSAFRGFAAAAARHFKGRVDRYSIWNEPNWRTWLAPSKSAPTQYRKLFATGYKAIKAVDRRAKVLIGETVPYKRRGFSTSPVAFMRKVTCLKNNFKRAKRCPKLTADGYAHHPYEFKRSPTYKYPGKDNATMGTLKNLTRGLDRISRTRQLRKRGGGKLPVYLTEFGYFASGNRMISKRKRTKYLQKAFTIALKNRRVKSQLQYLLVSPPKRTAFAFFNTGLINASGKKYPQYNALARWYRKNKRKVKKPRKFSLPAARPPLEPAS